MARRLGLLSATYLVLAAVRGLGTGDSHGALVSVAAAAITFGFAAAVLPIMVPRRRPDRPDSDGPRNPSPDEPPQPPWWPEFERQFRRHVLDSGRNAGEREARTARRDPTPR